MPVPELPVDLWKLVLQHVPLQQRLGACALVCHKFHAAAVAATDSIQTRLLYQHKVNRFVGYLQQHGSHLTSIIVNERQETDDWLVMKQFPSCQHLQQLSLSGFELQLSPSGGLPDALDSLTGLTRLELRDCNFNSYRVNPSRRGGGGALSVLVNLRHLCLEHDAESDDYPIPDLQLASLQHLTHLELSYVELEGEDLRHVSSLTKLRVLHIYSPMCRGLYLLGALEKLHHLHTLCLSEVIVKWPPPCPAYRALVASSNLRSLTFDCYTPAGALAHVFASAHTLQLTKLELQRCPSLDAGTVRALVNCCPVLQELQMSV